MAVLSGKDTETIRTFAGQERENFDNRACRQSHLTGQNVETARPSDRRSPPRDDPGPATGGMGKCVNRPGCSLWGQESKNARKDP